MTQTGTFDRWAESVIENTYGRVSFLSDPVILPTLYMPEKASADDSAFSYSETPIYDYMQGLGHDMQQDFHTVAVRTLGIPQTVDEWVAVTCCCALCGGWCG